MSFHRIGDLVLHAELAGAAGRPVLVFSNSLGTDFRIWAATVAALRDRYAILLYDKRGHGLSDAPQAPYSIDQHADDLIGLIDHFGIARAAIIGLSVGGMIAQAVATRVPERVAALVLSDTAAKIGTTETWNVRIAAVETAGIDSIADAVLERWFTPAYRAAEAAALRGWRNMLSRQPAHGYIGTCAAVRDADLTAAAGTIRSPTLVLVGDGDLSTPPDLVEATAALIPGARFDIIAGAGHIPCVEQPARFIAAISRHLSEAGHG